MRNTRLPVSLNEITCTITDTAPATTSPPTIASTSSCLVAPATEPSSPPSASEPVSPMKIEAGGGLDQRKDRKSTRLKSSHTDIYRLPFFFFNSPATTEISPLSLHAALPIYRAEQSAERERAGVAHEDRGGRRVEPEE